MNKTKLILVSKKENGGETSPYERYLSNNHHQEEDSQFKAVKRRHITREEKE